MDQINQVGKYIKNVYRNTEFSLKRNVEPEKSVERIRDIFDSQDSFKAGVTVPPAARKVTLNIDFGRKLPALGCCGDCMCGITESYTSDSLINGSIYVTTPYVPSSTVVYLDGFIATKNTDYMEVNPETGQIAILVPATTIVISYVYTVGNCTEALCVDELFECLPYTYYSGLVTVFSDRWDREMSPYPSGGCGVYTNFTGSTLVNPASFFGWRAYVGGDNQVAGASWEIIAAIQPNIGSSISIFGSNAYHTNNRCIIDTDTGIMELTLSGLSGDNPSATTTIPWEDDVRYWVRYVQTPTGWGLKVWPIFSTEPSGFQLQLTSAFTSLPTISFVGVSLTQGVGFEALQVGAALDIGAWGRTFSAGGVLGSYCSSPPNDGLIRPVAFCDPETSTATTQTVDLPECEFTTSTPVFATGPAVLINHTEQVAHWNVANGHPSGIKVKGQLIASFTHDVNVPINVQIKSYGSAPTLMTRNGFQGGSAIAGYSIPVETPGNGTPVDVEFIIPAGTSSSVYWGMSIVSLDAFCATLPNDMGFINFGSVSFQNITTEGLSSVRCNAVPFCNCLEEEE